MPDTFWASCVKILYSEEEDRYGGSWVCMSASQHLKNRCGTSILECQEERLSGDDIITMVVKNIRLDGVCRHFRDIFQQLSAAHFSRVVLCQCCVPLAALPVEATAELRDRDPSIHLGLGGKPASV